MVVLLLFVILVLIIRSSGLVAEVLNLTFFKSAQVVTWVLAIKVVAVSDYNLGAIVIRRTAIVNVVTCIFLFLDAGFVVNNALEVDRLEVPVVLAVVRVDDDIFVCVNRVFRLA